MSLCAPVYVPVGSTALRPVAVCLQELVTGKAPKDLFLSSSQMQSLRAQHPGVTRPRGTRQAELWERGGEGPPLLPLTPVLGGRTPAAAPQSCAGRKDPHCCPSLLRWEEGPPLLPLTPVLGGSLGSSPTGRCGGGGGLPGGSSHGR